MTPPTGAAAARARWRAAEDRFYPALLADPAAYQRGLAAVHAVIGELRGRHADLAELLAVDAAPEEMLATACPGGSPVPAELLVAAACGIWDRELSARLDAERRERAIEVARAAGSAWAVLSGPPTVAALLGADDAPGAWPVGGRRLTLHLASGTLLEVVVDPWDRGDPFAVTRTPGESRTFRDRDAWLAEIAGLEADIEAATG